MCDATTECYWSLKYERAKTQIQKLEDAISRRNIRISELQQLCPATFLYMLERHDELWMAEIKHEAYMMDAVRMAREYETELARIKALTPEQFVAEFKGESNG